MYVCTFCVIAIPFHKIRIDISSKCVSKGDKLKLINCHKLITYTFMDRDGVLQRYMISLHVTGPNGI